MSPVGSSWRRLARLYAITLALAVLSPGCGRREDDDARTRHIVLWDKWTGFEGEALDRVVELYNRHQRERAELEPDYRPIRVEKVTVSAIEQKLLVAIAGGNPPDVAGTYSYLIAAYVDRGALVDLTDRFAAAGISAERYVPVYWDLVSYHGRVWGAPSTPATTALHWNKRLFREAGLDPEKPPATIEELDAYAERLTRWEVTHPDGSRETLSGYLPDVPGDRKRLVQAGFLPGVPAWWNWSWGFHFGGRLHDGDRVTAADPGNVRAFEWFASYSKRLGVPEVQRFRSGFGNFSSPQNPFLSAKLAMQIQGVWMYNFIDKYAPGMQWGTAPFPHPEHRPDLARPSLNEADVFVIPKDASHPDEAFDFIRFLSSQQAMELLCLGQRKFSPLLEVSEWFRREHPHPNLEMFRSLSFSKAGFSTPKLGVYPQYKRELDAAVDAIGNLSKTPEDALLEVQVRIQDAHDRDRKRVLRRRD
jgi:ABC-type glycerol-3-phosphate transport system substrate-binding protein